MFFFQNYRFESVSQSMFEMYRNFNRWQWMIFIVFSISNFCQSICISLQAPFYPHEAEKKGATPTGQHP